MPRKVEFVVHPRVPDELAALEKIAKNLLWCWDHSAIDLFRRIDPEVWEEVGHNPIRLLGEVAQERLDALARDRAFLAHMERVIESHEAYMKGESSWYSRSGDRDEREAGPWVAYFSMEYGITECLPIYSGGLGVLAGDFFKSSSDLGIPMVGIGILYQQGYFQQYLDSNGWQKEEYPFLHFDKLPLTPAEDPGRKGPLVVEVPMGERSIKARAWEAQIGRNRLVFLDTNLPENPPDLKTVSYRLYGGDRENRIRQEILLGIGGVRTLSMLGLNPRVYHMNEGHSAFLSLERIRMLVERDGLSVDEAMEAVRATSIFTTHTPVPAGNDYFDPGLVLRYLEKYCSSFGLPREKLLSLGRVHQENSAEDFCMTVLALRCSAHRNGVSRLHGRISRAMWKDVWPGLEEDDVPIGHVTNGVHLETWINKDFAMLFDSYLGPGWREGVPEKKLWERIKDIPHAELWRSHERRRERLVGFARQRLRLSYARRGATRTTLAEVSEALDPSVLTIGFARRFATYKRADLLFRDPDRLAGILNHPEMPMQILFSGKAHPRDEEGKRIIQKIMHFAREKRFFSRIVFLEDYDQNTARRMVQGVDVWLNLPRRPLEASGTSGMKAVFNGALHVSVLDGWWDEAWHPDIGWAVGKGEIYESKELQDEVEASALYDLLEKEVKPMFYVRGPDGVPRRWVEMMKDSMVSLIPRFHACRMVGDYMMKFYKPASALLVELSKDGYKGARELGDFRRRIAGSWKEVAIEDMVCKTGHEPKVGDRVKVEATIRLGNLSPTDVAVEAFYGPLDPEGNFLAKESKYLENFEESGPGKFTFSGEIVVSFTGKFGVKVLVTPEHPLLCDRRGWGFIV